MLEAALKWAGYGWSVFPLHTPVFPGDGSPVRCTCHKGSACAHIGKHPRTTNGHKAATTDEAQIRTWWAQWPDANIGVATGEGVGFVVIDVDPRHGGDGTLGDLEAKYGRLPHTVEQLTGGGGRHLCFAYPGVYVKSRSDLRPGIDVKGDGGYIVVEPSLHESGHRYAFELSSYPGEVPLADMPGWLRDIVFEEPGRAVAHDAPRSTQRLHGIIPEGKRDDTLTSLAGTMRWKGFTREAIAAALHEQNEACCRPPLSREQVDKIARSVGRYEPGTGEPPPPPVEFAAKSVRELLRHHPDLRRPVVEGILREGELLNFVSVSKGNKSWLATHLAICVAAGLPWLGFATTKARVLILDNELHEETSAHRIPLVAKALGVSLEAIADAIDVDNLRGRCFDMLNLGAYLAAVPRGRYGLIVLDAFYRFIPQGFDENSNADMTVLYNKLDALAAALGCAIVLVHHTTKGSQSGKAVTDVGAGAGAQSRATDAHLVLRPHEDDDAVVVEAAVRSWAPVDPLCLRWKFPVWQIDESLDPTQLQRAGRRARDNGATGGKPGKKAWTPEQFVREFVSEQPRTKDMIVDAAHKAGVTKKDAGVLLDQAAADGRIHKWGGISREKLQYATAPPRDPDARVCVRASPPTPPVGAQAPRGRGESQKHTHSASGDSGRTGKGAA